VGLDIVLSPDDKINFGVTAMVMQKVKTSTEEFEKRQRSETGQSTFFGCMLQDDTKVNQAIANVQKLCEKYLKGYYELEVIDIYQQPKLAKGEQIIATPTLIKKLLCHSGSSSAICRIRKVSCRHRSETQKNS